MRGRVDYSYYGIFERMVFGCVCGGGVSASSCLNLSQAPVRFIMFTSFSSRKYIVRKSALVWSTGE